ncbi:MAG: hypothetical protein U0163_17995 [Gemmatimonadaceae bacterium]
MSSCDPSTTASSTLPSGSRPNCRAGKPGARGPSPPDRAGHRALARVERDDDPRHIIDEERFALAAGILRDLRDKYRLDGDVDVAAVLRMPDVISSNAEVAESDAADLVALVDRAVDA